MAAPFDTTHVLEPKFIPISIEYEYNVQIEQLRNRQENRNLEASKIFRSFSLSLSGDDPALHHEYTLLKTAYLRARGPFEGFYLKLPRVIEPDLIPVRFDSPFRFRYVVQNDYTGDIVWDIQELRLIEIPAP